MSKIIVCIDPGHGGKDTGCTGFGFKEKDINLAFSKRLAHYINLLSEGSIKTVLTRSEDDTTSLSYRTAYAKGANASVFISIHCNAGGISDVKKTAHGCEALVKDGSYSFTRLQQLANSLLSAIPLASRGLKLRDNLYVLNNFNNSVLIELGFLSNALDAVKLVGKQWQETTAIAMAKDVCNYFGITPNTSLI